MAKKVQNDWSAKIASIRSKNILKRKFKRKSEKNILHNPNSPKKGELRLCKEKGIVSKFNGSQWRSICFVIECYKEVQKEGHYVVCKAHLNKLYEEILIEQQKNNMRQLKKTIIINAKIEIDQCFGILEKSQQDKLQKIHDITEINEIKEIKKELSELTKKLTIAYGERYVDQQNFKKNLIKNAKIEIDQKFGEAIFEKSHQQVKIESNEVKKEVVPKKLSQRLKIIKIVYKID